MVCFGSEIVVLSDDVFGVMKYGVLVLILCIVGLENML